MMWLPVLGPAAVVAVAAGYWYWRPRKGEVPEVHHCRCPRCGLTMRFGARYSGRKVMCPRCLGTCTLTGEGQETARPRTKGIGSN
jgi:hypothetical protein